MLEDKYLQKSLSKLKKNNLEKKIELEDNKKEIKNKEAQARHEEAVRRILSGEKDEF